MDELIGGLVIEIITGVRRGRKKLGAEYATWRFCFCWMLNKVRNSFENVSCVMCTLDQRLDI